jgi:hypothetical protein
MEKLRKRGCQLKIRASILGGSFSRTVTGWKDFEIVQALGNNDESGGLTSQSDQLPHIWHKVAAEGLKRQLSLRQSRAQCEL